MDRSNFPKHAPPGPIRCKDKIMVIISNIFSTRVWRPTSKISIMGFQELGSHRGGSRHNDIDEPEPEVHKRPMNTGQGRNGVVGHRAQMGQVSNDGPWFWAGREREGGAGEAAEEVVYRHGKGGGAEEEVEWGHGGCGECVCECLD